jgi:hypothetical protein
MTMQVDVIWTIVGFVLTLMVFSYIFGDNFLFRLATYLFIGVSAGFVVLTLMTQVFIPKLFNPLMTGTLDQRIIALVPLILGLLLLTKLTPRLARAGNISMAYLIGVGAAVMIGGLVMGSLLPQVIATVNLFDLKSGAATSGLVLQLVDAIFILVGTITTLMFFYFGARVRPNLPPQRSRLVEVLAQIGQVFIGITLGALFAGVYSAALAALIERVSSIWNFIKPLLG